ncbi:hypothetical protein BO94DRAFT_549611 [Aspergillus sclerotioniger CBS 115572]|uniref:REJ domain-containing protein n=1 Tax=Aspergillus sclerotioniger CBS 115572 TaxID=1450535 RepID=A0A317VLN3_9EURO|nr:hypothetical protein BO94DRAFT_549611 [Aspergillus sclerotioniger CBS 115572]PWY74479.1 hypothetical protein BO94DRAFT_549611 [Aspergillus sclerotioniger CBS 115572]
MIPVPIPALPSSPLLLLLLPLLLLNSRMVRQFSLSSFFSLPPRGQKDPVHPSSRPAPVGLRRSSPLPCFQGVRSFLAPQVGTSSPSFASTEKPTSSVPRSRSRGQEFLKRFDATHTRSPNCRSPPSPPVASATSPRSVPHDKPPSTLRFLRRPSSSSPSTRSPRAASAASTHSHPTRSRGEAFLQRFDSSHPRSPPVASATSARSVPRGTSIPRPCVVLRATSPRVYRCTSGTTPVVVPRATSTRSYIPIRSVASAKSCRSPRVSRGRAFLERFNATHPYPSPVASATSTRSVPRSPSVASATSAPSKPMKSVRFVETTTVVVVPRWILKWRDIHRCSWRSQVGQETTSNSSNGDRAP